ncbi:TonB-dependent receptor [Yeosuana sp. MJ-SS3]|uniref:TonB-dependent receptor n=1 Tax=Gilvirhabdus luticola TaxID=3079858 RepID=A0ABU3U7Z4_9FLAO|nr:TonB-dependent receptor plug domain-containing protein [Yeosuana sp. MJ-SS3]MDU8886421.1 TonB-dependent receptor [Yeosuana sp. MJ-SS3]
MKNKATIFGMLFSISICGFTQQHADSTKVQELEEVVITDSKFNLKRENSGKVITKITQKELQNLQGKTISEIINTTAGVEINGTKSSASQNLNYYVRGGRNRQLLILIDGVALTDPSQIANDYDLRLINPDQVESIEIQKGASSTLYGSGAATAVINIKLKEASKDKISANFRSTFGTNASQDDDGFSINDFRNNVSVNGSLNTFNYLASFGNQYTDGLSVISDGTEKDVYNAIYGNFKLGFKASNTFKLTTYGNFEKFKADFDNAFSMIDSDDLSISNQYRLGLSSEYKYNKGNITLNAAYNNIERYVQSSFPTQFFAESFIGDIFNRNNFNDKFYTVLGVNIQQSSMESFTIPFGSTDLEQSINPDVAEFSIVDPYINAVYISESGFNVNAGTRLNNHSEYGSHLVYSVNPSYRKEVGFGSIKGLASYSTAYITPSLYQLFEPTYGNADLQPEENTTLEIGAEIGISDKGNFSLVYFNRNEKNFIDFVDLGGFVFQYTNVDKEFTASGIEFVANYKLSEKIGLNANATFTKVDKDLNLRIPELKVNAQIDYQVCDATFLSMSYQFNDDRKDSVFNSSTFMNDEVTLKSYSLLDFYVSHNIIKNKMKVFANITNIFNEDYQELYGFTTEGRNFSLGFNLNL